MAAGRLLVPAIQDLSALPDDAYERALVTPVLLRLRHAIEEDSDKTPEEKEFVVSMQDIVEKLRDEGRVEGQQEGRQDALRSAIAEVYAARFGAVPDELTAILREERDFAVLLEWLRAAATSTADAFMALLRGRRVS